MSQVGLNFVQYNISVEIGGSSKGSNKFTCYLVRFNIFQTKKLETNIQTVGVISYKFICQ